MFPRVKKKDLLGSLISGSATVGLSQISGVGLLFIMQIVLARLLSDAEQYGILVWSFSVIQILLVMATLGMTATVLRFGPGYLAGKQAANYLELLKTARTTVLIAGTSSGILLVAWLFGTGIRDGGSTANDALLIMAIALPFGALGRLNGGVAQANRWFILAFLPERVLRPLFVILGCGLAYLYVAGTIRAVHAAWIITLSMVGWVCIQAVLIRVGNARFRSSVRILDEERSAAKKMRSEWRRASVPFLMVSMLSVGMYYGDILLLGLLADSPAAGEYFAASRLAQLVALPLVIVGGALAPRIAEFDSRGDGPQLQMVLKTGAHLSLWPTLLIAIVLAACPSFFLGLFGEEYAGAKPVLLFLVLAQVCNVAVGLVVTVINMTGNQKFNAYLLAAILTLNMGFNLLLIPIYGALGAGIANAICLILWNLIAYVFVKYRLNLEPSIMASLKR